MPRVTEILRRLRALADPDRAVGARRFFRIGPGQYGEGDRFLGIPVPLLRRLGREFRDVSVSEALELLRSPFHEARWLALLLLSEQYRKGDPETKEAIFTAYLDSMGRIDNWDLVDLSAPAIVGPHLQGRNRRILDRLARSGNLWERRIAVLATLHFIRQGEFADTLRLAEALLGDPHDLIHKAVGWMLREVGNRDEKTLLAFLDQHAAAMPRTMLRYATEKLSKEQRPHHRGQR